MLLRCLRNRKNALRPSLCKNGKKGSRYAMNAVFCREQGRCKPGDLPSILDDDFSADGRKRVKKPLWIAVFSSCIYSRMLKTAFRGFFFGVLG